MTVYAALSADITVTSEAARTGLVEASDSLYPPNQDLWGGLKHVHAPRKLVLVYSRHICHDDDSEFCSGKYWFR